MFEHILTNSNHRTMAWHKMCLLGGNYIYELFVYAVYGYSIFIDNTTITTFDFPFSHATSYKIWLPVYDLLVNVISALNHYYKYFKRICFIEIYFVFISTLEFTPLFKNITSFSEDTENGLE